MKLMVIVLCLFSERFLIHTFSFQRFSWFNNYVFFIKKISGNNSSFNNPWMTLAAIVLPVIALTSLVYLMFHSIFFGFVGLILSTAIFFYCLGPQNAFYPPSDTGTNGNDPEQIKNYLSLVNSQLFAVVFWYIVAGPIVVLTYRLISLCKIIDGVSEQSTQISDALEWIPARITALLFLIVGNFQRGYTIFTQYFFAKPDVNDKMLGECGLQAVRVDESDEIPMPSAEAMVEQAAVVLLVFIALFTLVAWL